MSSSELERIGAQEFRSKMLQVFWNQSLTLGAVKVFPGTIFLGDWQELMARVSYYLSHKYTIGNLEGSVTSLIGGVLIFALALLLSRTIFSDELLAQRQGLVTLGLELSGEQ